MSQAGSSLLLTMAQQASRDSSLIACQIAKMAHKQAGGWAGVAEALNLDENRLARLALCRRPQPPNFDHEVRQIAELVGVEPAALRKLFSATQPLPDAPKSKAAARPAAPRRFKTWLWAGAAVVLLLAALAGSLLLNTPAPEDQATLVIQQGQAQVQLTRPPALAWLAAPRQQAVAAGQMLVVKSGDHIRLAPGGAGQVRFYDGSLVELSDQTDLTIQALHTGSDSYQVQLHQLGGVTLSRVRRLLGVNDYFQIRTPSSTVSVRGTEFVVQVISPDTSRVLVAKGVVHVAAGSQAVDLHPGEQTLSAPGQPLQIYHQNAPLPIPVPPLDLPGFQSIPPDVSNGGGTTPPGQINTPPGQVNTPPGQVNTPPGQVNTPPGQVNTPPGQVNTPPGQANTPPGQANTPPGQVKVPPGQANTPPGQVNTPPGQANTPPGQENTPPGQVDNNNSNKDKDKDKDKGNNGKVK